MTTYTGTYVVGTDQDGGQQNQTLWGVYRGYLGDGASSGQNHTQILALENHIGGAVDVVMCGGSLNGTGYAGAIAGMAGAPQMVVMHYPVIAPGQSLHLAATTSTYNAQWTQFAHDMLAAGRGTTTGPCNLIVSAMWEAGGSRNSDNSNHGFVWAHGYHDPNTGQWNDPGDFQGAFQNFVTVCKAAGLFGAKFAFNAVSVGGVDWRTLYPGDAYCDVIEWDCYNAINRADLYPRTNQQAIWDNEQLPMWNQIFAFARAHGKLVGCGEYGMVQPAAGVTSGSTYTYHAADNALYFPLIHNLADANADIFAYLCLFNQNQSSSGVTTEEDTYWFFGTNPTTQSPSYYHNTNVTGPVYDSPAAQKNISLPVLMASMPLSGAMKVAISVPVLPSAVSFAEEGNQQHRLVLMEFG